MRVSILVILILTLGCDLLAQDLSNIEIYNTSNSGINYNQINCIEFDDQNRMWIGTQNGLNVFDIYGPTDKETFRKLSLTQDTTDELNKLASAKERISSKPLSPEIGLASSRTNFIPL